MTSFGEKWRNRKAVNEKYLQVVPVVAKSIQLKSKEVWLSVEAFSRPLLNFLFCFRSQKRKKKYLCALKINTNLSTLYRNLLWKYSQKDFIIRCSNSGYLVLCCAAFYYHGVLRNLRVTGTTWWYFSLTAFRYLQFFHQMTSHICCIIFYLI